MPFPRVSHRPAAAGALRPGPRPHTALASAVAAAVAAGLAGGRIGAQDFGEVRPPVGLQGGIVPGTEDASDDVGRPARMLESTSVDRFVRAAQDLLARDDHVGAIRILQDVIEGPDRRGAERGEWGRHRAEGPPGADRTGLGRRC